MLALLHPQDFKTSMVTLDLKLKDFFSIFQGAVSG